LSVTFYFSTPASAFGVELMPVWKKGRNMRMTLLDGSGKELTQFVQIDPGARFFGFTGGRVGAVRFSKLPDDAGSFAMGRMLYAPVK
jgi:hypothetical protein